MKFFLSQGLFSKILHPQQKKNIVKNLSKIASEKDTVELVIKENYLFLSGILGTIVYVFNVLLGGIITPEYSHIRNAVSELTQRGAPNIVILSTLFVVSALLILLFGIAIIMRYKHQNRKLYAGGVLIAIYGIFAALLASIFPQDPIGGESSFTGTMHLVIAGLTALAIMSGILLSGLGIDKQTVTWSGFKLYSFITVILVFGFGTPTPILIMNNIELLGLFERLTQLADLQWFVVFAAKLYIDINAKKANLPWM